MSNLQEMPRRALDRASAPQTAFASCSSVANTFGPRRDVAGEDSKRQVAVIAVIAATQTASGSLSLLSPSSPTSGSEGSEGRGQLCPRAEPHNCGDCLASPLKYLSPSTLLLFFHFIFRSAAPVSSFLFVFCSYYSWLLPVFWFPSSALIRMFILAACFYTFPRCLLVVAGQRSLFGLGKCPRVAGPGQAARPSPGETELVRETRRLGHCSCFSVCFFSALAKEEQSPHPTWVCGWCINLVAALMKS